MSRPYPSHHHFTVQPQAVAVSRAEKVLAPMTQDTVADIETLLIGKTSCQYLTPEAFHRLVKAWLGEHTCHHIVTLNPEMVMAAEKDSFFAKAVAAAAIRIPDGTGLVWARWYIRSEFWSLWPSLLAFPFVTVERIPGVEALQIIAAQCAQARLGVYLLGGTPTQVARAADQLRRLYPGLLIHSAPPHDYDVSGPLTLIHDINQKKPAALFVAYGAPRQTIWIENHKRLLPSVRIAMGVGGALAMLAEEKPRAPKFLQQLNAEWLWRLALEPGRLPRIWRATVQFPRLIHQQKQQRAK